MYGLDSIHADPVAKVEDTNEDYAAEQADIIFCSASGLDFPENFGLKVCISIFCD